MQRQTRPVVHALTIGAMAKSAQIDWTDPTRFDLRYYKTALCRHWELAKCLRGDACTFAHGRDELRPMDSEEVPPAV